MQDFYSLCLESGIKICGMNAEVSHNQWEYQIGPLTGIEAGDQLIISRYILLSFAEMQRFKINFHPKPHDELSGSGLHTNFSTKLTRSENGFNHIIKSMKFFEKDHKNYIKYCGEDNNKRLTGSHETCNKNQFKYGVGDRTASIRIPNQTKLDNKGYFEDRRPGSNADPYKITRLLYESFKKSC